MDDGGWQLPEGFSVLANQVAGHVFECKANTMGLLQQDNSGCVLKPYGKRECGEREFAFYSQVMHEANDTERAKALERVRAFVPKFYERVRLQVNQREHIFLKLEDLTAGMQLPCIMDIKIGKRTWDPQASAEKRAVEEKKYVKCKNVIGLCLPGFQVYHADEESGAVRLTRHSKEYGKQLDSEGFRTTIAMFLNAQRKVCPPLVADMLQQLYAIRAWFRHQTRYHFYASSLLVAYDYQVLREWQQEQVDSNNGGDSQHITATEATNGTQNGKPPQDPRPWVKVRMIDFAHVYESEDGSIDENYLGGLENLIGIVEDLQRGK